MVDSRLVESKVIMASYSKNITKKKSKVKDRIIKVVKINVSGMSPFAFLKCEAFFYFSTALSRQSPNFL